MATEQEIMVHLTLGMNAVEPMGHALELAKSLKEYFGYHPDFDKLEECIELASEFIETRR